MHPSLPMLPEGWACSSSFHHCTVFPKINLLQGIYFMFKVKAHQRNIVNILSESFQSSLSFPLQLLSEASPCNFFWRYMFIDWSGVVLLCLPVIGKHSPLAPAPVSAFPGGPKHDFLALELDCRLTPIELGSAPWPSRLGNAITIPLWLHLLLGAHS